MLNKLTLQICLSENEVIYLEAKFPLTAIACRRIFVILNALMPESDQEATDASECM